MNVKNYTFKIILLGEREVGKTAIIKRYVSNQFNLEPEPQPEVFFWKGLKIDGKSIRLAILDLVGEPYYYEASGVLALFDLTRLDTCLKLLSWIKGVRNSMWHENIPIIIVGNKHDLVRLREISKEEAIDTFRKVGNSEYMEASAKTGENVKESFEALAKLMIKKVEYNMNSNSYQKLEPEVKAFINYFYHDQVKTGDFESIPYTSRSYDFITYSKSSKSETSEYYLSKEKKISRDGYSPDIFYDLQKTMDKIKHLKIHFKKPILIKTNGNKKDFKYNTLNTFIKTLHIFTKISKDEYFLFSYLNIHYHDISSYCGVKLYNGYSILFDQGRILQEENHTVVGLNDILVNYIDKKFSYLKQWSNHQLHSYCRNNSLVAPGRKIEKIKTIQDSNPKKKPSLAFLNRLIKKPEIFRDVILHFLNPEEKNQFVNHSINSLFHSGRKDVKSILKTKYFFDLNLSADEKVDILFSYVQDFWGNDIDFTIFYYNLPQKEIEIQKYIREYYPLLKVDFNPGLQLRMTKWLPKKSNSRKHHKELTLPKIYPLFTSISRRFQKQLLGHASAKPLRDVCKTRGVKRWYDKNKASLIDSIIATLTSAEIVELLNAISESNKKIMEYRENWQSIAGFTGRRQNSVFGKEVSENDLNASINRINKKNNDQENQIKD